MNTIQPGDRVQIVSTNDDNDIQLIGKVGIVTQVYNGTVDVKIRETYQSLSKSTIVRRIEAEADEIQVNPLHQSNLYHIEYTMDKSAKMVARIYERQKDSSYKLIQEIDVDTLIWKYAHEQGVDD